MINIFHCVKPYVISIFYLLLHPEGVLDTHPAFVKAVGSHEYCAQYEIIEFI